MTRSTAVLLRFFRSVGSPITFVRNPATFVLRSVHGLAWNRIGDTRGVTAEQSLGRRQSRDRRLIVYGFGGPDREEMTRKRGSYLVDLADSEPVQPYPINVA